MRGGVLEDQVPARVVHHADLVVHRVGGEVLPRDGEPVGMQHAGVAQALEPQHEALAGAVQVGVVDHAVLDVPAGMAVHGAERLQHGEAVAIPGAAHEPGVGAAAAVGILTHHALGKFEQLRLGARRIHSELLQPVLADLQSPVVREHRVARQPVHHPVVAAGGPGLVVLGEELLPGRQVLQVGLHVEQQAVFVQLLGDVLLAEAERGDGGRIAGDEARRQLVDQVIAGQKVDLDVGVELLVQILVDGIVRYRGEPVAAGQNLEVVALAHVVVIPGRRVRAHRYQRQGVGQVQLRHCRTAASGAAALFLGGAGAEMDGRQQQGHHHGQPDQVSNRHFHLKIPPLGFLLPAERSLVPCRSLLHAGAHSLQRRH